MSYTRARFTKAAQDKLLGGFSRPQIIYYLEIALEELKKENAQLKKEITARDLDHDYEKRHHLNHHIKKIHEFLKWEKSQEEQYRRNWYAIHGDDSPPAW
jgi:FtsZ-binding cell division protein ZapB